MPARKRRWPLRRRLVALMLTVVTTALPATVFGYMILVFSSLYADVDDRLQDANRVASARYPFTDADTAPVVFDDISIEIVDRVGRTVRALQHQSRGGPDAPAAAQVAQVAHAVSAGEPVTAGTPDAAWRLLARPLPDGTWLLVAQPVTDLRNLHDRLVTVSLFAALAILLVTAGVTTRLVRYGLRPLVEIAGTATHITAGDLSRRLPVTNHDEVGQLAAALNSMLDRIETSFAERQAVEERLRRFVDDAGHELRTPVTAIRGWADLYRAGAVTDDELPTAMRRIADEARRMGVLVDQLLLLASLDRRAAASGIGADTGAAHRPVDLAEVARDAVLDARAVEPDRPLTTELSPPGVAVVHGDPNALHQVMANLLANIRAHTPAGTPARVHVHRVTAAGDDRVVLRVADEGPGIPAALRDKVFDRFFRADPGRAHGHGAGSGLGMSIVAAIVAGHGGEAYAEPVPRGFTVRITFPAADVDDAQ